MEITKRVRVALFHLLHEAITVRPAGGGLARLLLHRLAGGEVKRILMGLKGQEQGDAETTLLFLNCSLSQKNPPSNYQLAGIRLFAAPASGGASLSEVSGGCDQSLIPFKMALQEMGTQQSTGCARTTVRK